MLSYRLYTYDVRGNAKMVNTVLWDAYVENLIIARKLQAEIK